MTHCNTSLNKVPSKERVQSVDQISPDILKAADTVPSQENVCRYCGNTI